jgi:hypothetical protein
MPNTLFAVLLGILAVYAAWSAFKGASRARTGWLVLAAGAGLQTINLLSGYSMPLAVVTTVAILAGMWMVFGQGARPASR